MKYFFTLVCVLLMSVSSHAQEGTGEVKVINDIETIQVRDNIYVLVSPSGGNVTVSTGDDGTFLIDDNLAGRSEIIQSAAKALNNQEISFILNTHYHFDHTGGNEYFGNADAVIIAHENVRARLSTKQFIEFFKKELEALEKSGLPAITFDDDMTLHYNDDDVHFIHTPMAHTDGDVIAHFAQANVITGGDLLFNGFYPFIDVGAGGSITGVIAGVDVLLGLANDTTIIIPGHGPLMTKVDLQTYRDVLATISANVDALIKEDKTLEEVIEEKPTQVFDAAWGNGFIAPDAFTTIVYQSLSK